MRIHTNALSHRFFLMESTDLTLTWCETASKGCRSCRAATDSHFTLGNHPKNEIYSEKEKHFGMN